LASVAPLVILFDQPLSELKRKFQSLVDNSSDLLIEASVDQAHSSLKVQEGSVGFDVDWTEDPPALSGYRPVFLASSAPKALSALSIKLNADIAGGERVAPIAKAMLAFGARLVRQLSAAAVMWTPGKIVSDPVFFAENVENYAKGEVFPVLVTVDFDYENDERTLRSSGLAWFSGQEIKLHGGDLHGQELVRRAVRLVHDIGTNGAVTSPQRVPDLDPANTIDMVPVQEGDVLLCEICSKTDAIMQATTVH
jgi:hypothetical protein